jgi:hypothetical protein
MNSRLTAWEEKFPKSFQLEESPYSKLTRWHGYEVTKWCQAGTYFSIQVKKSFLEQKLLEQNLLEQKLLEQNLLEQKLLEQNLLEQKLLEQNLLEQKLFKQVLGH